MGRSNLAAVADYLRRLGSGAGGPVTDRLLLERFVRGDQAAFADIVARHGSLVFNVCRRVLSNEQDAEDAFQAAFVVLARKAGRAAWSDSIAAWLHEVAWRTAAEMRGRTARRRQRETPMAETPDVPAPAQHPWNELSALLDEELRRLPEKYRAPLVLCYLEGRARDEAAELLGWSEGSVKGRLERGRELLRQRLQKRGIALGLSAVLPAALAQAAPSQILVQQAVAVATVPGAAASSVVLVIAESVLAALSRGRVMAWAIPLGMLVAGAVAFAALRSPEPVPQQAVVPAAKVDAGPRRSAPAATAPAKLLGLELAPGPIIKQGGTVEGLAVAGDGKRFASAAFNDGYTLFAADGSQLHRWAKKGPHTLIAISPDDRLLAAGTITGDLAIYDLKTFEEKAAWRIGPGNVFSLAFTPDNQAVAVAHTSGVRLYAAADARPIHDLPGSYGRARGLHFLPKTGLLLFGGEDGAIHVWDWKGAKKVESWKTTHADAILSVALSNDGRLLATGGADKTVRLWDVDTHAELFTGSSEYPNTVAISPDGRIAACGDSKGMLRLWNTADGALLVETAAHSSGIQCVRFTIDGRRVITCGSDSRVAMWDIRVQEG